MNGQTLAVLSDALSYLPLPLTSQLLGEEAWSPIRPLTAAEAIDAVGAMIKSPHQADGWAQELTRQEAARRAHRILTAILLDALHVQTAGSGVARSDAATLMDELMDRLDVQTMRPHQPSPSEQVRRQWVAMARRVSPAVFHRDGGKCRWCGTRSNLTVDHRISIARGGTNDFDNLQTLCGSCNSSKGTRPELNA